MDIRSIRSFVFMDLETTGLPACEFFRTRITELCLISAQSDHISLGVIPRVQNKLTLCFNPQKRIHPEAETITGLYNDELVNESAFDEKSLNLLTNFLERLKKPVCFVAHNGYKFDYPILRAHIEMIEKSFPEDILCMDSLGAFREIINEQKIQISKPDQKQSTENKSDLGELSDDWDDILCEELSRIEESLSLTQPKRVSQASIETTPPVKKHCDVPAAPKHRRIRDSASTSNSKKPSAQRRLDFDQKKSIKNFKLGSVYEYLTEKSPLNAHQAEVDVKMMLECAVHLGDSFIEFANKNAISFNQIPKMEPK